MGSCPRIQVTLQKKFKTIIYFISNTEQKHITKNDDRAFAVALHQKHEYNHIQYSNVMYNIT